jgi:hypothetical protein
MKAATLFSVTAVLCFWGMVFGLTLDDLGFALLMFLAMLGSLFVAGRAFFCAGDSGNLPPDTRGNSSRGTTGPEDWGQW